MSASLGRPVARRPGRPRTRKSPAIAIVASPFQFEDGPVADGGVDLALAASSPDAYKVAVTRLVAVALQGDVDVERLEKVGPAAVDALAAAQRRRDAAYQAIWALRGAINATTIWRWKMVQGFDAAAFWREQANSLAGRQLRLPLTPNPTLDRAKRRGNDVSAARACRTREEALATAMYAREHGRHGYPLYERAAQLSADTAQALNVLTRMQVATDRRGEEARSNIILRAVDLASSRSEALEAAAAALRVGQAARGAALAAYRRAGEASITRAQALEVLERMRGLDPLVVASAESLPVYLRAIALSASVREIESVVVRAQRSATEVLAQADASTFINSVAVLASERIHELAS